MYLSIGIMYKKFFELYSVNQKKNIVTSDVEILCVKFQMF